MNPVEIADELSSLASAPFDADEFPWAFLRAFGNNETAIKRLKVSAVKSSDVPGGVLQTRRIHLAVCEAGKVDDTLAALKASTKTAKGKVQFVLATDGEHFAAEELETGDLHTCPYPEFADHIGFFLPLAGISTIQQVKDNPIDIKATGHLFKLYIELIRENPDWGSDARRQDLNQFVARIIFCLFAEDTGIFFGESLFSNTLQQMSDVSNTHEVIGELFRAMDTPIEKRAEGKFRPWADQFPYVNGGLFAGMREVPRFSKMARSFVLAAGRLNWREINPDIFGSMIQGIADEDERGSLGMHYTSVPNILKVLDPLFLDDLREQLEQAGDNSRKLLNLRRRIASIRVFDPACGSGNFLIVAYIKMREIEAEIIRRRNDDKRSWIKLTNFFGIDIKHFAVETARLSLLIAEFQSDARLIGQIEACNNILPLHKSGQIHCGNALHMNWMEICPPASKTDQTCPDPKNGTSIEAGASSEAPSVETYICGNPPYAGKGKKSEANQDDMDLVFSSRLEKWGYVDYVGCWFLMAADYCRATGAPAALVATNSICQGRQLPQLWPHILTGDIEIGFAHLSFKWSNNAAMNAGVICVIVGIQDASTSRRPKKIYDGEIATIVDNINAYLLRGETIYVESRPTALIDGMAPMLTGSVPNDAGYLLLSEDQLEELLATAPGAREWVHRYMGSQDFIQGEVRYCLQIGDQDLVRARSIPEIARRLDAVRELRLKSPKRETREHLANVPHRFQHQAKRAKSSLLIVPRVSSENRPYLPVGSIGRDTVVSDQAFFLNDAPLWCLALLASRLHLIWIAAVCGKMKTDYRYSNTLGWNTFPTPRLLDQHKADLTRCAENILLAREAHFPSTIAELYDAENMPSDLRRAHETNDDTLERIYVGRRFRNDTERLEKLFDLYSKIAK